MSIINVSLAPITHTNMVLDGTIYHYISTLTKTGTERQEAIQLQKST